ncbi:MAG: hypothetical protein JW841_14975 [Deltaproteobacteria bacterium]|nr:hypothetical protein [Deltaproteobacteria bacterium]
MSLDIIYLSILSLLLIINFCDKHKKASLKHASKVLGKSISSVKEKTKIVKERRHKYLVDIMTQNGWLNPDCCKTIRDLVTTARNESSSFSKMFSGFGIFTVSWVSAMFGAFASVALLLAETEKAPPNLGDAVFQLFINGFQVILLIVVIRIIATQIYETRYPKKRRLILLDSLLQDIVLLAEVSEHRKNKRGR